MFITNTARQVTEAVRGSNIVRYSHSVIYCFLIPFIVLFLPTEQCVQPNRTQPQPCALRRLLRGFLMPVLLLIEPI